MLEVRCCCQPQKLLGHIDVSDSEFWHKRVRRVKLRPVSDFVASSPDDVFADIISLPIQQFTQGKNMRYAVKAEGYSAEDLRNVQGFEAAP